MSYFESIDIEYVEELLNDLFPTFSKLPSSEKYFTIQNKLFEIWNAINKNLYLEPYIYELIAHLAAWLESIYPDKPLKYLLSEEFIKLEFNIPNGRGWLMYEGNRERFIVIQGELNYLYSDFCTNDDINTNIVIFISYLNCWLALLELEGESDVR
jgi:hypothetical protein